MDTSTSEMRAKAEAVMEVSVTILKVCDSLLEGTKADGVSSPAEALSLSKLVKALTRIYADVTKIIEDFSSIEDRGIVEPLHTRTEEFKVKLENTLTVASGLLEQWMESQ